MALDDKGHALDGLAQEVIRIFNARVSDYENAICAALNIRQPLDAHTKATDIARAVTRASFHGADGSHNWMADDESEDGGMFV